MGTGVVEEIDVEIHIDTMFQRDDIAPMHGFVSYLGNQTHPGTFLAEWIPSALLLLSIVPAVSLFTLAVCSNFVETLERCKRICCYNSKTMRPSGFLAARTDATLRYCPPHWHQFETSMLPVLPTRWPITFPLRTTNHTHIQCRRTQLHARAHTCMHAYVCTHTCGFPHTQTSVFLAFEFSFPSGV